MFVSGVMSLVSCLWCAALPRPVRKASGFPSSPQLFWRLCRWGTASPGLKGWTESRRLSARKAAKPRTKDGT